MSEEGKEGGREGREGGRARCSRGGSGRAERVREGGRQRGSDRELGRG